MTILYLAHRVPYPPDKGEKIRAYHQLQHLASRHRIHLLAIADARADVAHAEALRRVCASVEVVYRSSLRARWAAVAALPTRRSMSVAAFEDAALRRRVQRRLATDPPDVIVAYTCPMASYVAETRSIPRLLDFVDIDSEKWRAYAAVRPFPWSLLYGWEADRLARFEAAMAERFEAATFVSEAEQQLLAPRVPGGRFSVLPMGVDLDYFHPAPERTPPGPAIVFTGVMDYFPNTDAVRHFVRDVFPEVRRRVPTASFTIVGRRPSPDVTALARTEGVTVTGEVPDVRPYFARARAAVAPFRIARGVQSKVLEAMAMGLPVVAAPIALQGIAARGDDGMRQGATPEAFANALVTLLTDDDAWRRDAAAARAYVERRHRWADAGRALEDLLEQLVAAHGAGRPAEPRAR